MPDWSCRSGSIEEAEREQEADAGDHRQSRRSRPPEVARAARAALGGAPEVALGAVERAHVREVLDAAASHSTCAPSAAWVAVLRSRLLEHARDDAVEHPQAQGAVAAARRRGSDPPGGRAA